MRIVCISDTHGLGWDVEVPEGDLLIHAGDLTSRGSGAAWLRGCEWLGSLMHPHKVLIAGNHDFFAERNEDQARLYAERAGIEFLQDSGINIEGLNVWGSPWQPEFFNWAFNLPRGKALADVWAQIPDNTDILITHGPPYGWHDKTVRGDYVGCIDLLQRCSRLESLKLHVFGHIHEAYGVSGPLNNALANSVYAVNASTCTLNYKPTNKPIVFDWDGEKLTQVVDV